MPMLPFTEFSVLINPVADEPITALPRTEPSVNDAPSPAVVVLILMLVLPRACWLDRSDAGTVLPANSSMMFRGPPAPFSPARHGPLIPATAATSAAAAQMADVFMFHPLSFAEEGVRTTPKTRRCGQFYNVRLVGRYRIRAEAIQPAAIAANR